MTNRLTIQQVAPFTPIYNVLCDGVDIGTITSFPAEGPMGTIRYLGAVETVAAYTIAEVLAALEGNVERADYYESEGEIYDEDGSIAYMQMMERQSEVWDDSPW
jgi:hypothetical protein